MDVSGHRVGSKDKQAVIFIVAADINSTQFHFKFISYGHINKELCFGNKGSTQHNAGVFIYSKFTVPVPQIVNKGTTQEI